MIYTVKFGRDHQHQVQSESIFAATAAYMALSNSYAEVQLWEDADGHYGEPKLMKEQRTMYKAQ